MTIGEKIKKARHNARLTQSDVAGDEVTRNMVSAIESGKATPSLATLKYIADKLDLPLGYLVSGEDDLFFYEKKARIKIIKNALDEKNYSLCISLILKLDALDDELTYILTVCYFHLGVSAVKGGSLESGYDYLLKCLEFAPKTIYDTQRYEALASLYLSIAKNVNSPLLEFDEKRFYSLLDDTVDYEFYRYIVLDYTYNYSYPPYKIHIEAKQLIKERKYAEAVTKLLEIESKRGNFEYNAYVLYGVYTDLDTCYRNLFDFENAYRYSSKRISLLEGFKT